MRTAAVGRRQAAVVPVGGSSVELGILANNPDEICLDAGHIPKLSASPLAQLGVVAIILVGIRSDAGLDLKLGVQTFAQLDT